MSVTFTLNGEPVTLDPEGPTSALEALRDGLGIRSPKDGCSPQGACGCCTVLIDGKPAMTCLRDVTKLDGKTVTTLEGVDPAKRRILSQAFTETGGLQCGFCTPGMVMAAEGLLRRNPDPGEDDIRLALSGNICRCTGYVKIIEAVQAAARERQPEQAA